MTENKTGGLDFAAMLRGVSEPGTADQITLLPLDALHPDPENFYSLDGLDKLAESIELVGLMDPIRVRPDGESYVIVSGHRRTAAIRMIRDGGSDQFKDGVPCIVEFGEASDPMRRLRLIHANSYTRERSDAEKRREVEETRKALYELQAKGMKFPGRMRDHVAEAVNLTKTKIARLDAIGNRCHENILSAFDEGKINESVAYAFSRLDRALQKRIWVNHIRLGYKPEALTAEYVEKLGNLHRKISTTKCKKSSVGCWCVYAESRFDYAQKLTHFEGVRDNCFRGRCCIGCQSIGTCEWACVKCNDERAQAINEAERLKQQRQTDLEARQAAAARARQEHDEESAAIWARIGRAAEANGRDLEGVLDQLWESDGDVQQILRFVSGEDKDVQHYAIEFLDDCLIDLADLLGCSTDFLLGRTDVPEINRGERAEAGRQIAAPTEEAAAGTIRSLSWQTGTPPRVGRYFCRVRGNADAAEEPAKEFRFDWDGETWYFCGRPILSGMLVQDWWPLPDLEG